MAGWASCVIFSNLPPQVTGLNQKKLIWRAVCTVQVIRIKCTHSQATHWHQSPKAALCSQHAETFVNQRDEILTGRRDCSTRWLVKDPVSVIKLEQPPEGRCHRIPMEPCGLGLICPCHFRPVLDQGQTSRQGNFSKHSLLIALGK